MGFIRGSGLFFVGVLLLISFLIGNVLLVLSSSLEYNNVQEKITPVISTIIYKQINSSEIENSLNLMRTGCQQGKSQLTLGEDYQFVILCEDINTLSAQEVLDKQIEKFMNETYYKKYDCNFIKCFGENKMPFFLVSKMSHDYIKSKYYYVLAFSVLFAALVFLFTENKKNFPITVGILLVLSSLPFMKLNVFSSAVSGNYSSQIFSLFFEQARVIFWWMLVIGIILIGVGIFLRVWNFEEHPIFKFGKTEVGKKKVKSEKKKK